MIKVTRAFITTRYHREKRYQMCKLYGLYETSLPLLQQEKTVSNVQAIRAIRDQLATAPARKNKGNGISTGHCIHSHMCITMLAHRQFSRSSNEQEGRGATTGWRGATAHAQAH